MGHSLWLRTLGTSGTGEALVEKQALLHHVEAASLCIRKNVKKYVETIRQKSRYCVTNQIFWPP